MTRDDYLPENHAVTRRGRPRAMRLVSFLSYLRFDKIVCNLIGKCYAQVAELVDAPASGAGLRK